MSYQQRMKQNIDNKPDGIFKNTQQNSHEAKIDYKTD